VRRAARDGCRQVLKTGRIHVRMERDREEAGELVYP
jgi:hypothetical protein